MTINKRRVRPDQVLEFIDVFAGQENTADEVRDFIQLAARFVDGGKTRSEWRAEPILFAFVEWLDEIDAIYRRDRRAHKR